MPLPGRLDYEIEHYKIEQNKERLFEIKNLYENVVPRSNITAGIISHIP